MAESQKIIFALHGAGLHGGIWGGLAPFLGDYQLMTETMPGHREDKPGPLLLTIEEMAKTAQKRLSSFALNSVILVGHSMGALIALELAGHPSVGGVILMGASADMKVDASLLDAARNDPPAAQAIIAKAGVAKTGQSAAITEMVQAIQSAVDPAAIHADLKACNDYTRGAAMAATIAKPALVISGENDRLAPMTQGHDLADHLQRGEFVILSQCGHMMMLEQPIETAKAIIDFLKSNNIA